MKMKTKKRKEKQRRKKKSKAVEESLPSSSPSRSRSPSPLPSPSSSRSQTSVPSPALSASPSGSGLSPPSSSPPRPQRLPDSPSPSPSPSSSRSRSRSSSPRSQSSTSSSERGSRRPPPPSSSEALVAETEGTGEAKVLYLLINYLSGPIAYAVYSVDIPESIHFSSAEACDQMSEPNTIYPILEIGVGEYPTGMCCVELDSKLYFLAGEYGLDFEPSEKLKRRRELNHTDFMGAYPPDVYVLDAATIAANATAISASNSPSELLEEGTPMNTGKPYPYVFVADRKIYAIAGHGRPRWSRWSRYEETEQLTRFEVFDHDSNKWSILPDPPMNVTLTGHAVVDRKVFITTLDNRVFYYHLDECEWVSFSNHYLYNGFDRRAEFVEDTLYASYYATVAAFGPTSEAEPDSKAKGLFDHMALLSPEMNLPTTKALSCLVHLENRLFCSAFTGTLPNPNYPNNVFSVDPERLEIGLTIFEALRGNYTKFSSDCEKTFFRAKFVHSAHFIARSRCGAHADTSSLQGCFSVSSNAGKIARSSGEREHYTYGTS